MNTNNKDYMKEYILPSILFISVAILSCLASNKTIRVYSGLVIIPMMSFFLGMIFSKNNKYVFKAFLIPSIALLIVSQKVIALFYSSLLFMMMFLCIGYLINELIAYNKTVLSNILNEAEKQYKKASIYTAWVPVLLWLIFVLVIYISTVSYATDILNFNHLINQNFEDVLSYVTVGVQLGVFSIIILMQGFYISYKKMPTIKSVAPILIGMSMTSIMFFGNLSGITMMIYPIASSIIGLGLGKVISMLKNRDM